MSAPAKHVDPNNNNSAPTKAGYTGNKKSSNITPFRVFARVRPFIPTELEGTTSEKLRSCIEMIDNKTILLNPNEDFAPKAEYGFDDSFWSIPDDYKMKKVFADTDRKPCASQKMVYDAVASSAADLAMEGINTCILSYGQTGTGKTYSMLGAYSTEEVKGGDGPEGIIPRVALDVLTLVEAKNKELEEKKKKGEIPSSGEGEVNYKVNVAFIEIYTEKVRDLLDPNLKGRKDAENTNTVMKEAKIRLDPESGPYIEGLTKYEVDSWKAICPLLERGQAMRRTAATTVHLQSSRSHAIFQITITEETKLKPKFVGGPPQIAKKTGRINLVDLAGSERGGHQDYVKESSQINKSLLTLRRVIDQLVEKQNAFFEKMRQELTAAGGAAVASPATPATPAGSPATTTAVASEKAVVPYRESVLTWLLSDSIGGNACTTMIAALSPHSKNFAETYSTLLWSSKARGLVSVVKVNDVNKSVTQGMGSKLQEMEDRLHLQRQNVDSIRQELAMKGDMISEMEMELRRARDATKRAGDSGDTFIAIAAALTIQRGHLANRQGKSISKLTQAIETVEAELDGSETEYKQLQETQMSLERTLADEQDKLGQTTNDLQSLKAILLELQKKDEENKPELERLRKEQDDEDQQEQQQQTQNAPDNQNLEGTLGGTVGGGGKKETMDEMKHRHQEEIRAEKQKQEDAKQKAAQVAAETKQMRDKDIEELKKKIEEKKNSPEEQRKRAEATKEAEQFEGQNKTLKDENDIIQQEKSGLEAKLKELNAKLMALQKKK